MPFDFIEQKIAGEQIEGAQAIAFSPLAMDKALLGANGIGRMMHADRSLM